MGTRAIAYTLFAVSRVVSLRSDMSDASCEVIGVVRTVVVSSVLYTRRLYGSLEENAG